MSAEGKRILSLFHQHEAKQTLSLFDSAHFCDFIHAVLLQWEPIDFGHVVNLHEFSIVHFLEYFALLNILPKALSLLFGASLRHLQNTLHHYRTDFVGCLHDATSKEFCGMILRMVIHQLILPDQLVHVFKVRIGVQTHDLVVVLIVREPAHLFLITIVGLEYGKKLGQVRHPLLAGVLETLEDACEQFFGLLDLGHDDSEIKFGPSNEILFLQISSVIESCIDDIG